MRLFYVLMIVFACGVSSGFELKTKVSEPYDFVEAGFGVATISISSAPQVQLEVNLKAADNRADAMDKNARNKLSGLSWNYPVPGILKQPESLTLKTDSHGGAQIILTDIIGERTVTLIIKAVAGEKKKVVEVIAEFGKGPLSLFEYPYEKRVDWTEGFNICNGYEYTGNPLRWIVLQGHEGGKRMPSVEELQAVAMPSAKNPVKHAFGASVSAGWKEGTYWTGRALMPSRASHVRLSDGNIHGTGGKNVEDVDNLVCLKEENSMK